MSIAASSAKLMFSGEFSKHSRDGNKLNARFKLGPGLFDSMLPKFSRGVMCNYLTGSNDGTFLISAGCSLLRSDWKFTAKVGGPISSAYPYHLYLTNLARVVGPAPTFFANWFVPGMIEWGAGANINRRMIIASATPVAGALMVTLDDYLKTIPVVGDDVVLYPGCDGTTGACKAYDVNDNPTGKFDNYDNFGGNPFTPVNNPSTTGLPDLNQTGAKK
jgi:hypothetical protein